MATKVSTSDLVNLDNPVTAVGTINLNIRNLATAIDNTLSRDGTSPNPMNAQLDMNSNRIVNLPAPVGDTEPARLVDVRTGITGPAGTNATFTVGTTTTLTAGSSATVTNVGTSTAAILNFGIPAGPAGAVGISGTPTVNQFAAWVDGTTVKGVSITGLVKGNGASAPTAAVAGTDYLAPPSGTALLKANSGGALANAASGTDYAPATSGSGLLKANGAGGFATPGTGDTLTIGTIELGAATDTTISRASAGVIAIEGVNLTPNLPVTSKSVAYTAVLADANTAIYHPSTDNNARTFTIDSNANVAYPVGTCLTFINDINTVTIAITTDTLVLAGVGTTGSRTLGVNGVATAHKVASTRWYIAGVGLT